MTATLAPRPGRRAVPTVARVVAALTLLVALVGALASGAAGQAEEATAVPVRATTVDATGSVVELSLLGASPTTSAAEITLTVDGEMVEASKVTTAQAVGRPVEVVYVVDTNIRSARGDTLTVVKEHLRSAISDLPAGASVGVVSAGNSALVMSRLTSDRGEQLAAVDALASKNGSVLFNALDRAGTLFTHEPGAVRSLVIVATGPDTGSEIGVREAEVSLLQRGVQVVSVVYDDGEPHIADAVSRSAGVELVADSPLTLPGILDQAAALAADRLLVSFPSPEDAGARVGVDVQIAGSRVELSYPNGVMTDISLQLEPLPEPTSSELGFLHSDIGLYVAIGLAFVGISLGVWSVSSIMVGGDASLEGLLARYTDEGLEAIDGEVDELIVQSALLQRAVSFSESFAEKQGFLARVEDLLERANLPIRAGEAMFMLFAITVLTAGFGLVLTRSVLVAGLLAVFACGLSFFVVRFLGRRRFRAFEAQLPDTLQLLSGTLRAGYSLPQGLDAVSTEVADPMGGELRRAMTEARLGRDLEDCLNGVADRLSSADFAWAVMAIGIQREVGGNLNELLLSVADTMIARERLKREVAALTAEGRMSAGVLSFLPPGLGAVMWVLNPGYVGLLFSETLGNILLGLGVVSALVGLAWMKKVITVDV